MQITTRRKKVHLWMSIIIVAGFLVACGPSQDTLDAAETVVAVNNHGTQTALAPTATNIPTETPVPSPTVTIIPSETPTPTEPAQSLTAKQAALLNVEQIEALSEELGIVQWGMDEELLGESRLCRTFLGQSWSASPNYALNCIWTVQSGITFPEALDWLASANYISSDAVPLESTFDYGRDFALMGTLGDNGHSVYDAFFMQGRFLYWASISVGTPIGYSPESLYDNQGEAIDAFLYAVLMGNLGTND